MGHDKEQIHITIECDKDAVEKTILDVYAKVKYEYRLNFEMNTSYSKVECKED